MVDACRECRANRPVQRWEPLRPTELPERLWQKLGADLCALQGKNFLVVTDYYSRWLEVRQLHSTTASSVINKFRMIFATHGIPEVVVSDNGPQFQCREFHGFAREYDFQHQTSSPGFPQANGVTESAVKVAKKLLQQADPDLALLNYRATPHSSTGVSPAAALMGRQLRTKLPILPNNLQPSHPGDGVIRRADGKAKAGQKQSYDRRHGVVPLAPLKPGESVRIRTDAEQHWSRVRLSRPTPAVVPTSSTYLAGSSDATGSTCSSCHHRQGRTKSIIGGGGGFRRGFRGPHRPPGGVKGLFFCFVSFREGTCIGQGGGGVSGIQETPPRSGPDRRCQVQRTSDMTFRRTSEIPRTSHHLLLQAHRSLTDR